MPWSIRACAVTAFGTLLISSVLACTNETRVNLLEPVASGGSSFGGSRLPDAAAPDASAGGGAERPDAAPSVSHLLHRYSFTGDGTYVLDSVGGADGILKGGATLDGAGHVALDGLDDYVDLPNGLVSSLTDATFVAWLSWNGGDCWQRVFDFGSTDMGEDIVGNATSSIFATTLRCGAAEGGTPGPATAFETATAINGSVDSNTPFPVLQNLPIVVVFDVTGGELRLYEAGAFIGAGLIEPLSRISDVNDWLGQSQWVQDLHLRGTFDEFRIYDAALTAEQIAALEKAGPDVPGP